MDSGKSSAIQGGGYAFAGLVVGNSIGTVLEFLLRGEVREVKNIKGNVINDFCASSCCGPCALAQMEYETRGKKGVPTKPLELGQGTGVRNVSVFKMDKFWENTMS